MSVFKIKIPVRPKCVQSTRFGGGHSYVDPKVRAWKLAIIPYIEEAKPPIPSERPIRINKLVYKFALPKSASKKVKQQLLENGGWLPYTGRADCTDNLNKGLIDCCSGRIFQDDKQIWHIREIMKVYAMDDGIEIELEET